MMGFENKKQNLEWYTAWRYWTMYREQQFPVFYFQETDNINILNMNNKAYFFLRDYSV